MRFFGRLLMITVFVVLPIVVYGQADACSPTCSPGRWSTAAKDISFPENANQEIKVYSPDGEAVLRIAKGRWWVELEGRRILPPKSHSEAPLHSEVGWAQDGRSFFITGSDAWTTNYQTEVYRIEKHQLVVYTSLNRAVKKEIELHHKCVDRNDNISSPPNIAGLKWIDGSSRLLVVAEVPPLGICGEQMRYFDGFVVSPETGRIQEHFSPEEMNEREGSVLGEILRNDYSRLDPSRRTIKP